MKRYSTIASDIYLSEYKVVYTERYSTIASDIYLSEYKLVYTLNDLQLHETIRLDKLCNTSNGPEAQYREHLLLWSKLSHGSANNYYKSIISAQNTTNISHTHVLKNKTWS